MHVLKVTRSDKRRLLYFRDSAEACLVMFTAAALAALRLGGRAVAVMFSVGE